MFLKKEKKGITKGSIVTMRDCSEYFILTGKLNENKEEYVELKILESYSSIYYNLECLKGLQDKNLTCRLKSKIFVKKSNLTLVEDRDWFFKKTFGEFKDEAKNYLYEKFGIKKI